MPHSIVHLLGCTISVVYTFPRRKGNRNLGRDQKKLDDLRKRLQLDTITTLSRRLTLYVQGGSIKEHLKTHQIHINRIIVNIISR